MTQDVKHSPLPWGPYCDEDGVILAVRIWTSGGKSFGIFDKPSNRTYAEWQGDAQFIVTACNSHYELVEALERAQKALNMLIDASTIPNTTSATAWANCVEAESKIRNALAKVKP